MYLELSFISNAIVLNGIILEVKQEMNIGKTEFQ